MEVGQADLRTFALCLANMRNFVAVVSEHMALYGTVCEYYTTHARCHGHARCARVRAETEMRNDQTGRRTKGAPTVV